MMTRSTLPPPWRLDSGGEGRADGSSAAQIKRTQEIGVRVQVTGGAGYIGGHTAKALAAAGIEPVVLDSAGLASAFAGVLSNNPGLAGEYWP